MIEFLMHEDKDNVGVAVVDITAGSNVSGRSLHGKSKPRVKVSMDIPLGHKLALQDFKPGDTVIKYGEDIGKMVADADVGMHVHVQNLKTKRW